MRKKQENVALASYLAAANKNQVDEPKEQPSQNPSKPKISFDFLDRDFDNKKSSKFLEDLVG